LRPPKGRTWGRRGHTPVVRVTGGSNKRVSLAALIAIKPGQAPRLIYRVHKNRRRRGDQRKGFTEADYAHFFDAAHQQLAGPLVVVWDNLNCHVSAAMAELAAARDWLTVFQLPPYAHQLNPAASLVTPQTLPGQPCQTQPRPAHRADQDPAQADAIPAQPPRRLPRQHRPGPHTLL
jgi:DDE superfamily endonuclease